MGSSNLGEQCVLINPLNAANSFGSKNENNEKLQLHGYDEIGNL